MKERRIFSTWGPKAEFPLVVYKKERDRYSVLKRKKSDNSVAILNIR